MLTNARYCQTYDTLDYMWVQCTPGQFLQIASTIAKKLVGAQDF